MKLFLIALFLPIMAFSKVSIEIDSCYGTPRHIVLGGVVLNRVDDKNQTKKDGKFKNLIKKSQDILFNKAQEHKTIDIYLNKFKYQTKTDDEGYFNFQAKTKNRFFSNNSNIKFQFEDKKIYTNCKPIIINSKEKIGVISDFDDTLIVSNVTNKMSLFRNSFLRNYKQRIVINGMNGWIKKILKNTQGAFFVITGSPKQFNNSINNFLNLHNFPKRVLITKKTSGKNKDPLFDQFNYKYKKIIKLTNLYPHIKWVMFGDSGEKDLQVYKAIAKEYPSNVKGIFIRDVKNGKIKKILGKINHP